MISIFTTLGPLKGPNVSNYRALQGPIYTCIDPCRGLLLGVNYPNITLN